jgi:hypothetical protein
VRVDEFQPPASTRLPGQKQSLTGMTDGACPQNHARDRKLICYVARGARHMPTLLNNYDVVLAVSQTTINNQFYLLFAEGVIDSTIDIAYVPTLPALKLQATINAPTVDLVLNPVSPYQLNFNLSFQSGTFTYMDYAKDATNPQSADVSGWNVTLLVSLQKMTIDTAAPAGLAVSQSAQTALSPYVGDSAFTVQALFLDFDNVNLSQMIVQAAGVQMQPSDARYPWVLTAMQQLFAGLETSGNPYILGFHAASNDPAQTNPQLPALAPTRVQFISNQYTPPAGAQSSTADDGLSALCYLAMTGTAPFPYPDGKVPVFVWNPITDAQLQARMFIDSATFNSGYIQALVLPVLQQAMGGGQFSQSGNSWTLDAKSGDKGHGPKIGSGILDVYGKSTVENYCTLSLDLQHSTGNQLVYTGSGYFYRRLDLYQKPLNIWSHDAWASSRLPFTFSLTISAGASATLNATFTPVAGTPQNDSWRNDAIKLGDAFLGLFTKTVADGLKAVNDSWSAFQSAEFSSFTAAAQQGFHALSQQLVLPAPQTFYYSNIALNSENDVVLDIGFKS